MTFKFKHRFLLWNFGGSDEQVITRKSNSPMRDDDVPKADLTSPPTPVKESAPVPKEAIIDGWSWPPGVGGAEREDGAPGGSGGDFVERGDELGVDRGEAWWFWINQRNALQEAEQIQSLLPDRTAPSLTLICVKLSGMLQDAFQLGVHKLQLSPLHCSCCKHTPITGRDKEQWQ